MKSIKNIALTALLTIGAFGVVTFTSCKKDDEGCATGYEGTDCKTLMTAKFVGTWTASDTELPSSPQPTYTAAISTSANITDIKIGNFSDGFFTNDVVGTVNGTNVTVTSQEPDNDGYKVAGTATYNTSDSKITWSYTLTSPLGQTLSYSGTWSK